MNNTFYMIEKYNPFHKKWDFVISIRNNNRYQTLEEAQSVVEKHTGDHKLRIVKLALLSIIEEKPHLQGVGE